MDFLQNQGAAGAAPPQQPPDNGKMVSLSDKIYSAECYARNESSAYPMTNLFIGDTRLGCMSDTDEQLILHIAFHEFVKVHSIKFTEFNRGIDPEQHPTVVKLFVNRESLGFEDIEDYEPTQTLQLTSADLAESAKPISLKYVRFQRVKSITVFIEDNAGGEITSLGSLNILGKPVLGTNMKDLKKQG